MVVVVVVAMMMTITAAATTFNIITITIIIIMSMRCLVVHFILHTAIRKPLMGILGLLFLLVGSL
jgi:hydrogenase-4 membrane subunit HyfE